MATAPDVITRPWPLTGRHEDLEEICAAVEEGCPAFFVSNHLQNAYSKLGISKRSELSAALIRFGHDPGGAP